MSIYFELLESLVSKSEPKESFKTSTSGHPTFSPFPSSTFHVPPSVVSTPSVKFSPDSLIARFELISRQKLNSSFSYSPPISPRARRSLMIFL